MSQKHQLVMIRFLGFVSLCLLGGAAFAVEVAGLYEAEVAVSSQQQSERTRAIRSALAEVLVKVSGRSDVREAPGVSGLLDSAMDYVQQYRYREGAQAPAQSTGSGLILWVRFAPPAIDEALRTRQLPVWGRARPTALIWLAIEQEGRRAIVDANSSSTVAMSIEARARRRGVPVLLPLMDLEDRRMLTVSDIWGNFTDNILQASKRYGTEAVLVGRMFGSAGVWSAHWSLHEGGQLTTWEARGTREDVIAAGIDTYADTLAAKFVASTVGGDTSTLLIRVSGISALEDYAGTLRYLESLGPIDQVNAVLVDVHSVIFRLRIRGDRQSVIQALALGGERRLVPEPTPVATVATTTPAPADNGQPTPLADLHYQLLKQSQP